ncbi:MAG: hypothetical protein J0L63_20275 [Anaerolineae bacterium]|nr:hypothetical protein [Anaerolineae bacterium]
MTPFFVRLSILVTFLFTIPLAVIHVQPYDDSDLRTILLPEDCPAPCFLGITPGITPIDEALQILETHTWVESYEYNPPSSIIIVEWNDTSPDWFTNEATIRIDENHITEIGLQTSLQLGQVQLLLGETSLRAISLGQFEGHNYLAYSTFYFDREIAAAVFKVCEQKGMRITFNDDTFLIFIDYGEVKQSDLSKAYPHTWADVVRTTCQ